MAGEAKRRKENMMLCPYCDHKYVPNKANVYRHLLIYVMQDGTMDAHGPLDNDTFMGEAIRMLEMMKRKYCRPIRKKKWWEVWK